MQKLTHETFNLRYTKTHENKLRGFFKHQLNYQHYQYLYFMKQWQNESTLEIAYPAPQFKILPWSSAGFFDWNGRRDTR